MAHTQRSTRRGFLRLVGGALAGGAAGSLLAACTQAPAAPTGGAKPAGSGAPGPAPTAAQAAPAQGKPGPSNVKLTVGNGNPINSLDMMKWSHATTESVVRHINEPLLVFDDDMKTMKPVLAESWNRVNESTMQFKLRQGVKFHNGEDFTADAVKFTLERVKQPELKSQATPFFRPIEKVDVVDSHTVNVVTRGPDPVLLNRLLGPGASIIPPKYVQEKGDAILETAPVGTGPYCFVSYVKDQSLELEANPDYWGGMPSVGKVSMRTIPDAATRVAALRAGDVDIILPTPPSEVDAIDRSGRARVVAAEGVRVLRYAFTLRYPEVQDKRVRQAINYAIDWDSIIKNVQLGYVSRVATILPPATFGYDPKVTPYPYDPARATELLKEAGYGGGLELNADIVQGRLINDKETAEAMAGFLEKVGVKVNLILNEWARYLDKRAAGQFGQIGFNSWGNLWGDADFTLYQLYNSSVKGYGDSSLWEHAEFDQLTAAARSELDPAKRQQMYSRCQEILKEECPDIWAFLVKDIYGISNRVDWTPRGDEAVWAWKMQVKA